MLGILIAFANWSPGLGHEREVEAEAAFAAPEVCKHYNAGFANVCQQGVAWPQDNSASKACLQTNY